MNKSFLKLSTKEQILGWIWFAIQMFILSSALLVVLYLIGWVPSVATMNFILFLINFLAIILIFHNYFRTQLQAVQASSLLLWVPLGLALYFILSYAATIVVMILQPAHINANNEVVSQIYTQQPILIYITTVILAPVVEETLYRGLLFGSLYRIRPLYGYLATTVVFSAIHVISYIGQQDLFSLFISFLQYIPAGIALSVAYIRGGTLLTPIFMHMIINAYAISAMR